MNWGLCIRQDIPGLLPTVLNCVRLIWSVSNHYNTPERIMTLLRKVSNEVVHRCSCALDLTAVWDGNVDRTIITLQDSIHAGQAWKQAFAQALRGLSKYTCRPWNFDGNSIFSSVDAFVDRCRSVPQLALHSDADAT